MRNIVLHFEVLWRSKHFEKINKNVYSTATTN